MNSWWKMPPPRQWLPVGCRFMPAGALPESGFATETPVRFELHLCRPISSHASRYRRTDRNGSDVHSALRPLCRTSPCCACRRFLTSMASTSSLAGRIHSSCECSASCGVPIKRLLTAIEREHEEVDYSTGDWWRHRRVLDREHDAWPTPCPTRAATRTEMSNYRYVVTPAFGSRPCRLDSLRHGERPIADPRFLETIV